MHIVITGASSGLGQALAQRYAALFPGIAKLTLIGRNLSALQALQVQLTLTQGCQVAIYSVDVRDSEKMRQVAEQSLQCYGTPNIVIANAGVSRGTLTEYAEDTAAFQAVMDINVLGLVHTFQPFIVSMKQAAQNGKPATLVGIASVAGIRGLPGAGAYSASKAAAIAYLESLRVEMQMFGIRVTTIAPGYVRTPMTDINRYPMPFLMEADEFARQAVQAIAQGRRFCVIPWPMAIVARLLRLIPPLVWDSLMRRAPHKSRQAMLSNAPEDSTESYK